MKKLLTFFITGAAIAALGTACNENGQSGQSSEQGQNQESTPESELIHFTTDYIVVNKIESDIVVEFKSGDGLIKTIKPGESQVFFTEDTYTDPADRDEWADLKEFELMKYDPEIRIDGEVVWKRIWGYPYLKIETQGNFGSLENYFQVGEHYYRTLTWTITEEALEEVRLDKEFWETED